MNENKIANTLEEVIKALGGLSTNTHIPDFHECIAKGTQRRAENLTRTELFAAFACAGMLANTKHMKEHDSADEVAEEAFRVAYAMERCAWATHSRGEELLKRWEEQKVAEKASEMTPSHG